jgi:Ca2+:H+ antiporter
MAARRDSHGGWPAWAAPLAALAFAGLKHAHLLDAETAPFALAAALLLIGSVFAAVHHAEVVARKVGEPFGSILLALAVIAIETSLIVASMLSGGAVENSLARDTVFSVVLIVLNGVVGLCIVIGAVRYRQQTFRVEGAGAALSVLATLAVLTLVLPNFTVAKLGPQYSPTQLAFVGALSLILYLVFVFVQSVRHRDDFLPEREDGRGGRDEKAEPPSGAATGVSAVLMLASLAGVVLLAKTLSGSLERAIGAVGLPPSFLGVVIAMLTLMPESVAAIRAAYDNRSQTSLNLSAGSALASLGLTIPIVCAVSLYLSRELTLGLDAEGMALLLLTLFVSMPTLAIGRVTILQGAVHLVIFGVFLLLAAVP